MHTNRIKGVVQDGLETVFADFQCLLRMNEIGNVEVLNDDNGHLSMLIKNRRDVDVENQIHMPGKFQIFDLGRIVRGDKTI